MAGLTIELDPIALREATSQAIMGILTPELRAEILQRSIRTLLTASTDSWDKGKNPLQKAFDTAIERIAEQVALENILKDEQMQAKISELLTQVKDKLFTMDVDKLAEKMSNAFVSSLKERY